VSWAQDADMLVTVGEATYLSHWMRASGLASVSLSSDETVWVDDQTPIEVVERAVHVVADAYWMQLTL
jgi:hypothetical protein